MAAQEARISAVRDMVQRDNRSVAWPTSSEDRGRPSYVSEIFGSQVFNLKTLQQSIPKPVYARFIQQIKGRQSLDRPTADAVAHAVRVWSMNRGATHFTHWFQPQTGTTAEKHDSFLSLKASIHDGIEEISAIDVFSGSQLLQSEPDASSFPNGGMRSTFEARGYTIWDTTSPMFIRAGPHGTFILYVPSVFISYNGEALDEKTILLRSSEILSAACVKTLHLLGKTEVKRVYATLGTEQEFFLIDRALYNLRPDLKIAGRTLIGTVPPKHQQLEDHYFGQIPSRILAAISETELELYKLGVPIKTRHNEVAPNQFEMAPIFEEASVAVDHNLLLMETLHQVAHRHKLKVLFHEKPFKGVNGSGKHCNWSLSTDLGENLLDPTDKPETNYQFLIFLVATLDAVYKHSALLRSSIASSSNEHRLGANEAPPAIVSAFLGDHLTEVLNAIEESRSVKLPESQYRAVKVGGTVLDLKVSSLPQIARDLTDRNRTSPFAFTGNKFEFRAVGSKQSPSFPVVLLNAAVAGSLTEITDAIAKASGGKTPSGETILTVLKPYIVACKKIRFEGNGYSDEWIVEAAARGLPNIKSCPEAFAQLLSGSSKKLLTSLGIFSEDELSSRYHILIEKYVKDLVIEAETIRNMINQSILPSASQFKKQLIDVISGTTAAGLPVNNLPELSTLEKANDITTSLAANAGLLTACLESLDALPLEKQAITASTELIKLIESSRVFSDRLEAILDDKIWPFPKYLELLF